MNILGDPVGSGESDKKLSILFPCLNEAETLATCIDDAFDVIFQNGISGEVVVADNGSTDGSQILAIAHGARVTQIGPRGYGNAIRGGVRACAGRYVVIADSDASYDLCDAQIILRRLEDGYDLVLGNRFQGGIAVGAMPWSHQYIGNPILSGIGRLIFRSPVGDFHCGLRGFSRAAFETMELTSTGMEFATEMVIKASAQRLRVCEVPTKLRPDGRSRSPHLRSYRDGLRHLRLMLMSARKFSRFPTDLQPKN